MNKRNVFLLYGNSLLQGMVFYGPVATLYRRACGVDIFQITAIESASLLLCVALELPWGLAADRIGYKNTMVFCSALCVVSKAVFWKADGFGMFLLERLLLSVVMSGLSGVDVSLLFLSCGEREFHRVLGVYNSLLAAGLLFASAVYSLLLRDDYRLAGFLTVLSYAGALLLTLFLRDEKPGSPQGVRPREFRDILRGTLRDGGLLMLLGAAALLGETSQTVTVFLAQLQYDAEGMRGGGLGLASFLTTAAGLCGCFSHRLTERLGVKRTGTLLLVCGGASCGALALTGNAPLSVLLAVALRLSWSLFQPLSSSLQNRRISTGNRATALSAQAVLTEGAAILTNPAFGAAAKRALPLAMWLGCLFCLAGAALFLRLTNREEAATIKLTK